MVKRFSHLLPVAALMIGFGSQCHMSVLAAAPEKGSKSESVDKADEADRENDPHKKVVKINEAGLTSLNQKDYAGAIKKFREALDLEPHYSPAKTNLVAAYNAYGVSLKSKPKEAIIQYHHALSLDRTDAATQKNIDALITGLGLNPRNADARIKLADEAQAAGDQQGVGLEMEAADFLKSHPNQNAVYGDAGTAK